MRVHRFLPLALLGLVAGCALDPVTSVPALQAAPGGEKSLTLSYTVEGKRLAAIEGVAYYAIVDANGEAADGPLVNGPAPKSFPMPDARAYLPFVRDQRTVLDRTPQEVKDSSWTDFFALYAQNGQLVMWQGRRSMDGSVNEFYRQLQPGTEWGIVNGNTVQLTVPLSKLRTGPSAPGELEVNFAVAMRPPAGSASLIDFWRPSAAGSDAFVVLPGSGEAVSDSDPSRVALPGNTVGDGSALNLVNITAQVK